jgi:hypothetical protein
MVHEQQIVNNSRYYIVITTQTWRGGIILLPTLYFENGSGDYIEVPQVPRILKWESWKSSSYELC